MFVAWKCCSFSATFKPPHWIFTYSASPECSTVIQHLTLLFWKSVQTLTQQILLSISATYPTNKPSEGKAKSSVSEVNALSAAASVTEIADLCQCWVSRGRGVNFFLFFYARAANLRIAHCSWSLLGYCNMTTVHSLHILFISYT